MDNDNLHSSALSKQALKAARKVAKKLARAAEGTGDDRLIGRLDAAGADGQRGRLQSDEHAWYMSDINAYPVDQALFAGDLGRLIRDWVLPGHAPAQPMLDATQSVVTLGSCFARELRLYLEMCGVTATRFWIPSGLNNTFALLDFVTWCVTGEQTGRGYRYERSGEGAIREWTPATEQAAYRAALAEAGAFVFTLGLAEIWQDRDTGGVFWRGVPQDLFDAERHVSRLTSVDENVQNIGQLLSVIRMVNPTAPIVLTLSPVPLLATHRAISCLTADCVSKSVLRVALDQVMAASPPGVYYWPSFEIVKWVGATLPWSAYGQGGKARDVNRALVGAIIGAFIDAFYTPAAGATMAQRREALAQSAATGD
jgi:hypothetical protein